MLTGDVIQTALEKIGITDESVSQFIGRPCGCKERVARLNALHLWAQRVVSGKIEGAKEYLHRIMDME